MKTLADAILRCEKHLMGALEAYVLVATDEELDNAMHRRGRLWERLHDQMAALSDSRDGVVFELVGLCDDLADEEKVDQLEQLRLTLITRSDVIVAFVTKIARMRSALMSLDPEVPREIRSAVATWLDRQKFFKVPGVPSHELAAQYLRRFNAETIGTVSLKNQRDWLWAEVWAGQRIVCAYETL